MKLGIIDGEAVACGDNGLSSFDLIWHRQHYRSVFMTAVLSVAGIGVIAGRIVCGWCLDRFYGPYVAIVFLIIAAIGNAALASGAGGLVPISAGVLLAVGLGAEVGLIALFASRYFGLRAMARGCIGGNIGSPNRNFSLTGLN